MQVYEEYSHGRDRDRDRDRGRSGGGGGRERRGTPLTDLDPALTEVSRKLIGCAIEVHKALGPGFSEAVYQRSLQLELESIGVPYTVNHPFPVKFKGHEVGERVADMFIDNRFLVELMAEHREIGGYERAQLRATLRAADLELGLIINFAERRLKDGLVRVLNPDKLNAMKGDQPHDDMDDDGGFDADMPQA